MCNLYSVTKGQTAIREAARAMVDHTGNLPPLPGVFPDYAAPIVRNSPEGRELAMDGALGYAEPGVRAPGAARRSWWTTSAGSASSNIAPVRCASGARC